MYRYFCCGDGRWFNNLQKVLSCLNVCQKRRFNKYFCQSFLNRFLNTHLVSVQANYICIRTVIRTSNMLQLEYLVNLSNFNSQKSKRNIYSQSQLIKYCFLLSNGETIVSNQNYKFYSIVKNDQVPETYVVCQFRSVFHCCFDECRCAGIAWKRHSAWWLAKSYWQFSIKSMQ